MEAETRAASPRQACITVLLDVVTPSDIVVETHPTAPCVPQLSHSV